MSEERNNADKGGNPNPPHVPPFGGHWPWWLGGTGDWGEKGEPKN